MRKTASFTSGLLSFAFGLILPAFGVPMLASLFADPARTQTATSIAVAQIGASIATGSLEFTAHITPTAARPEPLRQFTFYTASDPRKRRGRTEAATRASAENLGRRPRLPRILSSCRPAQRGTLPHRAFFSR